MSCVTKVLCFHAGITCPKLMYTHYLILFHFDVKHWATVVHGLKFFCELAMSQFWICSADVSIDRIGIGCCLERENVQWLPNHGGFSYKKCVHLPFKQYLLLFPAMTEIHTVGQASNNNLSEIHTVAPKFKAVLCVVVVHVPTVCSGIAFLYCSLFSVWRRVFAARNILCIGTFVKPHLTWDLVMLLSLALSSSALGRIFN